MNIWKRLFARRSGDGSPVPTRPTCPFCGEAAEENPPHGATAYQVWKSQCGAVGSGSPMYPDLDEVADGLLSLLDIAGRVSEACIPTDGSGKILAQHYDIPKSLHQLEEILGTHNREMRTAKWTESGHTMHSIWVRQKVT